MRQVSKFTILLVSASMLAGCGGLGIFNKKPKTTVLGDRVAVLVNEADIEVDPATATLPMSLPAAAANDSWAQSGGNARKSMGHVALGNALGVAWTASIGQGSSNKGRLGGGPVVADGRIYTIDTMGTVRAFSASNGGQLWSARFGEIGNNSGSSLWRRRRLRQWPRLCDQRPRLCRGARCHQRCSDLDGPSRRPPTRRALGFGRSRLCDEPGQPDLFAEGRRWFEQLVQCCSAGNRGVSGSAAPSIGQGTVVAGFSSGELNAYRYENGRQVWQDALARTSITTSVSSLSDIDADPVIDGGVVYAIGQGGRMVALDLFSGQRIWELNFAGIATPWVAGDWVFAVNDRGQLVAIARATGKIKWINQLPRYESMKSKKGPITYVGPVLAGDRLVIAGSNGALINVNPTDGSFQSQVDVKDGISFQPVVANQTLYLLTDSGRLIAYR